MPVKPLKSVLAVLFGLALVAVASACGTAANPTNAPPSTITLPPTSASPGSGTATSIPNISIATASSTVTPLPTIMIGARDSITLAMNEEPITLNPYLTQGGISQAAGKDNLVDPLTWQAGDDQRIVPTTATVSWQQLDTDTWRFELRQGVKFHNGEPWNAPAALPSLAYQGVGSNDNSSFRVTGGFTAEAVGDYNLDINCDQACPIFPNTAFLLNFVAPDFLATATEEQQTRTTVGFGPYKLSQWQPGVSITQEAYDEYVAAGDDYEFQNPRIKDATWVWRGEPTVLAAMVQTREADLSWDVSVDQVKALPTEMLKAGSSAEVFAFYVNTLWHPELKKKKVREAMAHAINCQEIVDNLYGGLPPCRGNIIWPGVIGVTAHNAAPYEYNPDLAKSLLQEASYNPANVIKITGRASRIPKLVEVYEAMQAYLKTVGMNVEINAVDPSIWNEYGGCGMGKAVNEVLEAQGKDPSKDMPTIEDMRTAAEKGGPNCATADLRENQFSNENLDFGANANKVLNCVHPRSLVCDLSPGGLQAQLEPALAATGEERQRLLAVMADRLHDDVLLLPFFETQVFYAVNPKLNWTPRFDKRVRVNTMWFSP